MSQFDSIFDRILADVVGDISDSNNSLEADSPTKKSVSPPKLSTPPKGADSPTKKSVSSPKSSTPPKEAVSPLNLPSPTAKSASAHQSPSPPSHAASDAKSNDIDKLPEGPLFPRFPRITMGRAAWDSAVDFANHIRRSATQDEIEAITHAIIDQNMAQNSSELHPDFVRGLLIGAAIAEQEQAEREKTQ